jgi:hypothetical protein
MSFLVTNLPPVMTNLKLEYLHDFKSHHGQTTPCVWISAKAINLRALYIECYLPEYGALYDKIPISGYTTGVTSTLELPLEELEIWDAPAYHLTCITKEFLKNSRVGYRSPNHGIIPGKYMFTIDFANPDPNLPNVNCAEIPAEHKSMNVLELDNGQYCLSPNNRVLFYNKSLNPEQLKTPTFHYSTHIFSVEDKGRSFGDTKWDYEANK